MKYGNANVFIDGKFVPGGFCVEKGRFTEVFDRCDCAGDVDLQGACVIPGLVDIHVCGCGGGAFSLGDYDGLVSMARSLPKKGVTAFAPTAGLLSYEAIEQALSTAVLLRRHLPRDCAWPAAVHMAAPVSTEGRPDFDTFRSLFEFMGGIIGLVDVDPEAEGAMEFVERAKTFCAVSTEPGQTQPVYTRFRHALANGVPVEEAILAATLLPARRIGRDYEVGSIARYKRADFIVCDKDLNFLQVFLGGEAI